MDENLLERAKKRATYLLGGKDYSEKELIKKLTVNYPEDVSKTVAAWLREYGYIDDERYAKKLARLYVEVRKYGKSKAKMMLIQKGISSETADEALGQYTKDELALEIADLIRKKYCDRLFIDGAEGKKEAQKVIAALARRGYGYSEIKQAIDMVLEDE